MLLGLDVTLLSQHAAAQASPAGARLEPGLPRLLPLAQALQRRVHALQLLRLALQGSEHWGEGCGMHSAFGNCMLHLARPALKAMHEPDAALGDIRFGDIRFGDTSS